MIKIAHARSSESKSKYGKAGDQTGHEVEVSNYYEGKNISVYRPKDPAVADRIASLMTQACNNRYIGYSQDDRYSLYDAAVRFDFKLDKIVEWCNCDCSSLVAVCCIACGINVPKTMRTGNMEGHMKASGAFDVLKGDVTLQRGDIVRRTGHTFVVVQGEEQTQPDPGDKIDYAKSKDLSIAGHYQPRTIANVRAGAGTDKLWLGTIDSTVKLRCYGFYTVDKRGVKWLLCTVLNGDHKGGTGFISERTVKRL